MPANALMFPNATIQTQSVFSVFYAAIACLLFRSGSYTSPVTHSRCNSTASFRATATTARFLAFLPPRPQMRSPNRFRSLSCPLAPSMWCAQFTSVFRRYTSPALVMPNCGLLSPESCCFYCIPKNAPTSRLFAKRSGSPMVSMNDSAVCTPTPFTCSNNRYFGYRSRAICSSISS